jgi:hypothetical protein
MSASEINLGQPTVLKINYGGKTYEVRRPRFKELSDYQVRLSQIKDDEQKMMNEILDFLANLGFPKDVSMELEVDQMERLIESVTSKKK